MSSNRSGRHLFVLAVALVAGIAALLATRVVVESDTLVVYCAHDALYAQEVLDRFTAETGIPVSIRFDTEATKSLGLVNLIIAERGHPRCDVFWNNQVLGTVQLQGEGLLEPYRGAGWQRIPEAFRDSGGHWTGFGGRLRVYIVNTQAMEASESALATRLEGDLSRAAIAKPLFGTTLSHYSLLWHLWGPVKLHAWHAKLRERGVREVAGNATVKNLVAEAVCDFGWTDTDDFFVAKDDNAPVAMFPVHVDDATTICIPNSAAIIRGTRRLEQARRLVDFLASAETELALSLSKSRQIPLGDVDPQSLSEDVRQLRDWAADAFDITNAASARADCLQWLKGEYLD